MGRVRGRARVRVGARGRVGLRAPGRFAAYPLSSGEG